MKGFATQLKLQAIHKIVRVPPVMQIIVRVRCG
jgi:hypothetical protein